MSDFDFINFMRIGDTDRGAKGEQRLNDLRERATYLAKKTGQEPITWYEFKQSVPIEQPKSIRNLAIGALIGGAIGAFFGIPAAVSLAITGGAIGAFSDTENLRRDEAVRKYEAYLDGFEASLGRSPNMGLAMNAVQGKYAQQVLAERQQNNIGIGF